MAIGIPDYGNLSRNFNNSYIKFDYGNRKLSDYGNRDLRLWQSAKKLFVTIRKNRLGQSTGQWPFPIMAIGILDYGNLSKNFDIFKNPIMAIESVAIMEIVG